MSPLPPCRIARRLRLSAAIALAVAGLAWAQPASELPAELVPYFNAIRQVESRGHPWSIFDNTDRRSYRLNSRVEAEAKAQELIRYGHNLDLGLMQLNCKYQCRRPGVSLANIFDPEVNVAVARTIFSEFWAQARRVSTEFTTRIIAAVGAYNNGRVHLPNPGYVTKVWRELGRPVAEIPSAGGTPATAVATAADGWSGKKLMDDTLGRAERGARWARDRLSAITGHGKGASPQGQGPEQGRPTADGAPPSATEVAGGVLGGLGILGALVAGAGAFLVLSKLFGFWSALRITAQAVKRKDKTA